VPELVKFDFEDGSSIVIEAEDVASGPVMRGGDAGTALAKANQTFDSALRQVAPTSRAIVERFRDLPDRPDEIEVEFGLKLNAEVGAIIARTGGEANFRILLHWKA
jgi:Trypsin-co-occurring domain 1